MNQKQQSHKFAVISHYLQSELKNQQALQKYYLKKHQELKKKRNKLNTLCLETTLLNPSSIINSNLKQKTESIMINSRVNNNHLQQPITDKSQIINQSFNKIKEKVTFQTEYQTMTLQLKKVIDNIIDKQQKAAIRKDFQKTNKSLSFVNKSLRGSVIITDKGSPNKSKIKTDRSLIAPSKIEKIQSQLCDPFALASDDEIINNLLNHLKQEEQRYVKGVLKHTELSLQLKMKSYLSKQLERCQEELYRLKEQVRQKEDQVYQSNKETVRRGYTDSMKEAVDRGLRGREVFSASKPIS